MFTAKLFLIDKYRFYGHYPDLSDQAINAMLDLCEDRNVDIRKQAIKVTKC